MKRSSLEERVSKFSPNMFYEIDPCLSYFRFQWPLTAFLISEAGFDLNQLQ
jgi:hypothetical protein